MHDMGHLYNKQYFEGVGSDYKGYTYEEIYPWATVVAESLNRTVKPITGVLDVGCAKGFLVLAFANLGIDVHGVDMSPYGVSESPGEIRDRLHVCNIEQDQLPFEDGFFDLVVMSDVIEHLHSFDHALKEVKRVLKPAGYAFVKTPGDHKEAARDTTHVNVHRKTYWINLFRESNLTEDAEAQRKFSLEYRKRLTNLIHSLPPSSPIGHVLTRMRPLGQDIRANLGSYIWRKGCHVFILRKEEFFRNQL